MLRCNRVDRADLPWTLGKSPVCFRGVVQGARHCISHIRLWAFLRLTTDSRCWLTQSKLEWFCAYVYVLYLLPCLFVFYCFAAVFFPPHAQLWICMFMETSLWNATPGGGRMKSVPTASAFPDFRGPIFCRRQNEYSSKNNDNKIATCVLLPSPF